MKKILTASLVAIMAVSAANADIASTKYVDDQTGVSADGTFGFEGVISGQTTLAGAVKKIAGELGTGGSVTTQITNALKDATADDFSADVKTSLGLANTAVQTTTFENFQSTNETAIADAKQEAIDAAAADATTKANTAESNAKTYAEQKASAAQAAAEATAAGALASAKSELEGKITEAGADTTELAGRVDTIEKSAAYTSGIDSTKVAQIETNKTGVAANLASIQAINNEQTGILAQAKADATTKANAAQTAAEGKVTALETGKVAQNAAAISTLNTNTTGIQISNVANIGSVDGNYALTAKVVDGKVSEYTWEMIGR